MAAPATALTIVEKVEQSAAIASLTADAPKFMELLGTEEKVARFRRGVVVAMAKNPDLLTCTPQSILLACYEAAQQGLEPTGAAGGAHLVPYKLKDGTKVAQLIPDYRGVVRLITQPPSEVLSVEARVVKEGDEFSYQLGSDAWVNHVPKLDAERSSRATTHVYALFTLRSGKVIPDVEDRAGIERIRSRSRSGAQGPWATDWDEMGKKTIVKRGSKLCPVRPDVRAIIVREDELAGDADADPTLEQLPAGPTKVSRLAGRIRNVTPAEDDGAAAASPGPAEPASAEAPPDWAQADAEPELSLVERLQQSVEASSLEGPMTDPQKKRVGELIGQASGLDWATEALPVLAAAFGEGFEPRDMTAAQAQAVSNIADAFAAAEPPIDFAEAWREAAR